jgi:HEAT repeat protein
VLRAADPRARFYAATKLRDARGLEELQRLTMTLDASDQLRGRAVEAAVEGWGYEQARNVVTTALESRNSSAVRAALGAAAKARDATLLPAIVALEADATAAAAAAALGEIGDAQAEPALISMLAHVDAEVREAAARALGKLGTVRAVQFLLPFTEGVLHPHVAAAARDAIRSIQARLGDVAAGRLAIAPDAAEAGALSVASEPVPLKEK